MATYNITLNGRSALDAQAPIQELGTGTIITTPNGSDTVQVELTITSGTLAGFDITVTASSSNCGQNAQTLQYVPSKVPTSFSFIAALVLVVPTLQQFNAVAGFVALTYKANGYLADVIPSNF